MRRVLRISQVVHGLGTALDLLEERPDGHRVRRAWTGLHIGQELGLSAEQRMDLYCVLSLSRVAGTGGRRVGGPALGSLAARGAGIPNPVYARIGALVDTFDAARLDAGPEAGLAAAAGWAGGRFDRVLVDALRHTVALYHFTPALGDAALPRWVASLIPGDVPFDADEAAVDQVIRAFGELLAAKSPHTCGHSARVAQAAEHLAEALDVDTATRGVIRRAGMLHDIGKLAVPTEILEKPGPLSEAEWREMRQHAAWTDAILGGIEGLAEETAAAAAHHERLDGAGYPSGLSGTAVPFAARVVTCVDLFDALVSDRPYRAALPVSEALAILEPQVGTALDPACFGALTRCLDRGAGRLRAVG